MKILSIVPVLLSLCAAASVCQGNEIARKAIKDPASVQVRDYTRITKEGTEGSKVTIDVGDNLLDWAVPSTGSWNDYRTVAAGTLTLPADKTELTISTAEKPSEGVANIRMVTLKPVKAAR